MKYTILNTIQRTAFFICLMLSTHILQSAPFVYVANGGSNSVSVIDAATNEVIKTIDLGSNQLQVQIAITTDGKTVWVPCNGSVQLIDVATNTLLSPISLGSQQGNGVAMSPDGTYAYVISYDSGYDTGYITQFNTATQAVVSTVSGAFEPFLIFITPDGKTAYITNGGNKVLPVDLTTNPPTLQPELTLSSVGFMAISPDNTYLYVSESDSNMIQQYNIAGSNRLMPLPTQVIPSTPEPYFRPTGLAITSDGKTMYVASANSDYMAYAIGTLNISNPASPVMGTVITDASIINPVTIALTSDGNSLYVADFETNGMVNVINTSNALVPTFKTSIPVGIEPFALAITPSNSSPTNVSGCKTKNVFLLQTDYINKLTWTAPASGSPAAYNIYRDAALTDLAGSSTSLEFYDHNRQPNIIYSYYIVSVDASGNQSASASVTVNTPC